MTLLSELLTAWREYEKTERYDTIVNYPQKDGKIVKVTEQYPKQHTFEDFMSWLQQREEEK